MRLRGNNQGQASIFIGMMMMTFILFFAFVVNTGMLVNAKINLQNAADLAAYSGAASQARTLNTISFLNYEMRRAYKKFLFRYYVLGNMAQDGFPRGGGAEAPMLWSPDGTGANNFQVPAVCMVFNENDNFCHLNRLPKLAMPGSFGMDAVNQILLTQLKNIEDIRKTHCDQIGANNTFLLNLWLYNADPTFKFMKAQLTNPKQQEYLAINAGLGAGLGLMPEELLLWQRIQTLARIINAKPQSEITFSNASELAKGPDALENERTVNAFLSAYYTLGEHIFASDSISMDELLPMGGEGANLLKLKPVTARFEAYALAFTRNGDDCTPEFQILATPKSGITVGVQKDVTALTYYAVRLKAKAKVMFSPFGDMELKAYAAARPFGSRIGPPFEDDASWVRKGAQPPSLPSGMTLNFNAIPNLPVQKEDGTGQGQGWDSQITTGALFRSMNLAATHLIERQHYERGIQVAMAPNPWESNKYNIMNDLQPDNYNVFFDTTHIAALWAPLFTKDKAAAADELKKAIQEFVQAGASGTAGASAGGNLDPTQMATFLGEYLDILRQGKGVQGDGFRVTRITDPFFSRPEDPANNGVAKRLSAGKYVLMDPKQARTSYRSRVGYSVKFVSFDSLLHPKVSPNGSGLLPENPPQGGSGGEDDFEYLKH